MVKYLPWMCLFLISCDNRDVKDPVKIDNTNNCIVKVLTEFDNCKLYKVNCYPNSNTELYVSNCGETKWKEGKNDKMVK